MASELQCQRVIDPLNFGESAPWFRQLIIWWGTALLGLQVQFYQNNYMPRGRQSAHKREWMQITPWPGSFHHTCDRLDTGATFPPTGATTGPSHYPFLLWHQKFWQLVVPSPSIWVGDTSVRICMWNIYQCHDNEVERCMVLSPSFTTRLSTSA